VAAVEGNAASAAFATATSQSASVTCRQNRSITTTECPVRLGAVAGSTPARSIRSTVRDSRRRAAYDTSYAAEHPIKPAREGKDPTERFAPKASAPAATGGCTRIDGAELPDAEPIERPSRAVKARLKAGGLVHDAGAGSYLGPLVADFGGVAAGGLVFRPADGGAVFVTVAPVPPAARPATPPAPAPAPVASPASPAPRKRRAAKDAGEPDAAKDKALLDAFSAALQGAIGTG
jgi:hypothetical protein